MTGARVYRSTRWAIVLLTGVFAAAACSLADGGQGEVRTSPQRVASVDGRVDVGGFELAYECLGIGAPTIVAEAGYDSSGIDVWGGLLDDFSTISRVCTYDRAGTGASDRRTHPAGLTSGDQADELARLLQAAAIEPPYVFVAHSYGGFVARLFADAHRGSTEGLVLIESSHEEEIGAYRAFYGDAPAGDWVDGGDLLDMSATRRLLERARDLDPTPLVVITAERYEDVLDESLWTRTQADLATMSENSVHVVASGSGHLVVEPGNSPSVVVAAVDAVVEAARSGDPLPTCVEFVAGLAASCP